ncbi:MAG: AAA family ATPase [Pseudorhodoplanes sp.]|jgi:RecA-family ATPase|nr:AAA family ATPase [Pseudorhodoplanes sp.]
MKSLSPVGSVPVEIQRFGQPASAEPARIICAASWAGREIKPRAWIVPGLIPDRTPSICSGDGGTGKSLLALQLCVAMAIGKPWLGLETTPGAALFVSAEDEEDELHRRLDDICNSNAVSISDLNGLHLVPMAGRDAILAQFSKAGEMKRTALAEWLQETIRHRRPKLVVLDTLADVFAGDEIQRAQARAFIGMLRGFALDFDTAILLLSHPSLSGLSTGTGASGSTAWSNSVRSRLYFHRATTTDDAEPDPDLRVLTTMKANYGRAGTEIHVRWRDGVFIREESETGFDQLAAEMKADYAFLDLLRLMATQGRDVSTKPSPTYAPAIFAAHPQGKRITKRAYRAAMERLLASGKIRIEQIGPASKRRERIVLANAITPGGDDD